MEGVFSFLVAAFIWFGLPNDPAGGFFITQKDKEVLKIRVAERAAYMGSEKFDWQEVRHGLCDPKVYLRYVCHVVTC